MQHKLFAFDLDGTLLNDRKELSPANARALEEMAAAGGVIVFATGRLGSSIRNYIPAALDDVACLTLNGAEVCMGERHGSKRVHYAPLASAAADFLIEYSRDKPFVLNYYLDGKLYAVRNDLTARWADLYFEQTGTAYQWSPSLERFRGRAPSKAIFVGAPAVIDEQEQLFRRRWGDSVYICRTWEYYLEFLDVRANKASGLEALLEAYAVTWPEVAAFGDANNDIPLLEKAGLGIAVANAPDEVKRAAGRVSAWTNNDDAIAREWELIKKGV